MTTLPFDTPDEGDGIGPESEPERTYTVSELARAINATLRAGFGDGVWVRGEIQGWSDRGQHAYFTLADVGDASGATETVGGRGGRGRNAARARTGRTTEAVINVQFFANARSRLRPLLERHRLELADGLAVRVFGQLDFWAPGGRLGFKMSDLDPRFSLGELAIARDEILRRLRESGRIDRNRSLPLSPVPLRIGVVTSVGTAAWHDFHDELVRSEIGFHLHVVDTRVQGTTAHLAVAAAIGTLGRRTDLDAVVVIRGGGARNELATFDTAEIADAICDAHVPVLTGIGHEVDRSVADEVAHLALKTPTACAGALVERVRTAAVTAEDTWRAVEHAAERRLRTAVDEVTDRAHRIARRTHVAVERADQRLDGRRRSIAASAIRPLDDADRRLDRTRADIIGGSARALDGADQRLDLVEARLRSHDPAVLLARGWSITTDADGRVIRGIDQVTADDTVTTRLLDGVLTATVTSVRELRPRSDAASTDDIRRPDQEDPT